MIAIIIIVIGLVGIKIWKQNHIYDGISENRDSFDALIQSHRDSNVVGWLTVEDTAINTVVAQGDDNQKYLETDIDGNPSIAGTPFLDYRNDKLFRDPYSVIYGHHMGDHLMFSDLVLFTEESLWEIERKGSLELTDGRVFDITFFACLEATSTDSSYYDPILIRNNWNTESRKKLTEDAFIVKNTISENDQIIVLSTCADADSEKRIVVMGKLTQK